MEYNGQSMFFICIITLELEISEFRRPVVFFFFLLLLLFLFVVAPKIKHRVILQSTLKYLLFHGLAHLTSHYSY